MSPGILELINALDTYPSNFDALVYVHLFPLHAHDKQPAPSAKPIRLSADPLCAHGHAALAGGPSRVTLLFPICWSVVVPQWRRNTDQLGRAPWWIVSLKHGERELGSHQRTCGTSVREME